MIRIGIIGTGGMANGHAQRFNSIQGSKVTACCDIVPGRAREFAAKHGIPAAYGAVDEMLRKETLDGVTIVTVDSAHAPTALAAIRRGVHVMCEKPLASNLRDAQRMAAAAARKGVITAVNFSYRNSPATQRAAQLVAAGKLGRILHVEGSYLQSWLVSRGWGDWRKSPAMLWRLSTRHGSGGVLGDIGVHLYDLASFVVGDFAAIASELKTFGKGPKRIGAYVFDANDSVVSMVRFANGAIGTLHTTRWATGHMNTVALRVYGDKGALDLNLDRPAPDTLRACFAPDLDRAQWMPVRCPPVPDMYQRFITAIRTSRQGQTSFAGGARVQAYLDASFTAARKGGFVTIRG
jgi:predicted dehydrogenase